MEGSRGTDALPTEIVQEIALHIPDIAGLTSFSLVDHHVDSALTTPAVYARRVASRGWDVDTWIEHYPMTEGGAETISNWKKIDYVHEKLEKLLSQDVSTLFQRYYDLNSSQGNQMQVIHAKDLHIDLYMELMDVLIPVLKHNRMCIYSF